MPEMDPDHQPPSGDWTSTDAVPTASTEKASSTKEARADQRQRHKATVILLSSTILMLLWKYFGSAEFYAGTLAERIDWGHPAAMAAFYQFGTCLLLLGVIPALIVRLVFHERLADYGLQFGHRLYTARSILVAVPILVLGGYCFGALDPAMREAFPVNKQAGSGTPFWLHGATYMLYYLGWEFHFRGFLQFGLQESMGRSGAIMVQVMASALLHIGQPSVETFGAIIGGIVWGWFAFRTKSILSGTAQHFALGLTVDAVIVFA